MGVNFNSLEVFDLCRTCIKKWADFKRSLSSHTDQHVVVPCPYCVVKPLEPKDPREAAILIDNRLGQRIKKFFRTFGRMLNSEDCDLAFFMTCVFAIILHAALSGSIEMAAVLVAIVLGATVLGTLMHIYTINHLLP